MTTRHELALLRLAAQRIAGTGAPDAATAAAWMAAVQAQDPRSLLTSVALRTASGTRAEVEAAFDRGAAVKSWTMRGTLHVVASEDLPWMLELLTPRIVASMARRRADLRLDEAALERARESAVAALAGGGRMRRRELFELWDANGLGSKGGRGYHTLAYLAQTGTLCFGPMRGGEQALVLIGEWIPQPRRMEREEALGELALRYFRGHGPATAKDFTRWAYLTAADVRTALALARPHLTAADVEGTEYLMDPQTPDLLASCRDRARGVFLLPGFDEFVLGYADRGAVLPAEYADRIVPGANGVFKPTVVADGRIVGTWRHTGSGPRRGVEAAPFESFPAAVAAAIPEVHAGLP